MMTKPLNSMKGRLPLFLLISFLTVICGLFILSSQDSALFVSAGAELEDIEEIEEIEEVTEAGTPGFLEYLGRMHPALVHFPIGWLIMLVLIDLGAFVLRLESFEKWGLYVLIGSVLSFVPAIITGLLNASYLQDNASTLTTLAWHRNLNLLMAGLCVVALILRLKYRNRIAGGVKWAYLGLILIASVLMMAAGHMGGKMVFGENYLPF